MEPAALDWTSIVNICGAVNGIFLSFVVLKVGKGNRLTNRLLSLLLLVLSFVIIASILNRARLYLVFPHFIGVFAPFYFMLGPCIYLYIKSLTREEYAFTKTEWLHFSPYFIRLITLIPYYIMSGEQKIAAFIRFNTLPDVDYNTVVILQLLHLSLYLLLAIDLLKKHSANIKEFFSSVEKIRLDWLRYLVIFFTIFLWMYVLFALFRLYNTVLFAKIGSVFRIWETFMVFYVGYKGLIQPEIFREPAGEKRTAKYRTSTLTERQAKQYMKKLLQVMEAEKPYLESELTLRALAGRLSVPYAHLSQVINEELGQNFFDFINEYRVAEVRRRLLEQKINRNYPVLRVAFDSGFSSKSTFYQAFKKHFKMTPHQFLNEVSSKK